jgi:hypothetical protein
MLLAGVDAGLQAQIDSFWAIDDHAHPLPVGMELPGDPDQPIQPYDYPLPLRMRPDNPEYLEAWAALWGYEHRDFDPGHLRDLMERKSAVMAARGGAYNAWVLDQVRLKAMVNINIDLHDSLPQSRFPWCAHFEWLLWPFACDPMPGGPTRMMVQAMQDRQARLGLAGPPPTLDAFLTDVVQATLAQIKATGGVGIKFNTPYYRDLAFGDTPLADARALYARGLVQGSLGTADHKAVQDTIFRVLVTEAGRLDLGVQMHTGVGVRRQFHVAGSNPMLMESVFRDTPGTRFMLLHGGWPFVKETVALLAYNNVYTEFSCADIYHYPRTLAQQIREALEWYPEKLMYGTDAYSDRVFGMLSGLPPKANPLHGWEEKAWIIDRTGRQGLGIALSGMLQDGQITAARANELINLVMRDTVTGFHRLAL